MGLTKRQKAALMAATSEKEEIQIGAAALAEGSLELIQKILQKSNEGVLSAIKKMNDSRMAALEQLRRIKTEECSCEAWVAVQVAIEELDNES